MKEIWRPVPVPGYEGLYEISTHFENLNGVAKAGFQPSCVCNCCKGIRKTHKGYVWTYENRGAV